MNNLYKIVGITLILLLNGCGLSLPEFGDTSASSDNSTYYKIVLDENYNGYADDDDLTSAEIDNGAENFPQCSNATECSLLWDTAKEWITKKSTYKGDLTTDSKNLLLTKADVNKNKADKITFKVTRIPNGKTNIIKISANCPRKCSSYIDKEYFAFNSYLRNHLMAYKKGVIGYAQVEDEMLQNTVNSGELELDISDLSGSPEISIMEENDSLDKIEITKTKRKRYIGKVAEILIDNHSCNKQSEISLVKKTKKRELYEVNCIKEVKRLIFDCKPDGCEVLQ